VSFVARYARTLFVCTIGISVISATPAFAQAHMSTVTRGTGELPQADSTFRAALSAMAQGDEQGALVGFKEVIGKYPQSANAPNAMYDAAFLFYRRYHPGESTDPLRMALAVLTAMSKRYPGAPRIADAQTLQTRICGTLAAQGDRTCEREVMRAAHPPALMPKSRTTLRFTITQGDDSARAATLADSSACHGLNVSAVAAAVNGLWKTDTVQAIAVMKILIPNRHPCLEGLRERAILTMMGRQVHSLVPLVLDAARNDPDSAVRQRAYMWLVNQPRDAQLAANLDDLAKRNAPPVP